MKRAFSLFLLFSLMFALCACSGAPSSSPSAAKELAAVKLPSPSVSAAPAPSPSAPASSSAPSAEPSAEPSADPAPDPVFEYVSEYYGADGAYVDSVGNQYTFHFSVPCFDLPGSAVEAVNQNIVDMLMPPIDEANELMRSRFSLTVTEVGYDAYLNGDVVSLVARVVYDDVYASYFVWNMDVSSNSPVENDALFSSTGMGSDGTPLSSVTAACVGEYCAQHYKDLNRPFVREQYDKTLSEENLSQTQYYLDGDGMLQAIVRIYALAGAESYSAFVPLHR